MRRVCDRVYGEVVLPSLAALIVNTREFQRLDNIRQLGGCSYVYPSATHTRREHSIGVCHLAGKMAKHLQSLHPDHINDDDVLCVQIAGLIHDIGHGPFSHTFEDYIKSCGMEEWSHEHMGARLFRQVVTSGRIALSDHFDSGTSDQHLEFILWLSGGLGDEEPWPPEETIGRKKEKRFLLELVHSKISGIDVDKLDYLARDSLSVMGASRPIGIDRLINASRLLEVNGKFRLAFSEAVSFELAEVYSLRARLHQRLYQHHSVIVVESLLLELMQAIDTVLPMGSRIQDKALDCESFLDLTDDWITSLPRILPGFTAACSILDKLIQSPWYARTGSTVILKTLPSCLACQQETNIGDDFCSNCGESTSGRRREFIKGVSVPPEVLITSQSATELLQKKLGRTDVTVHVLDIHCGSAVLRYDSEGTPWRYYDPLETTVFYNHSTHTLVSASSKGQHVPHQRHFRSARCYLPLTASTSDLKTVDEAFVSWGVTVGTIATKSIS